MQGRHWSMATFWLTSGNLPVKVQHDRGRLIHHIQSLRQKGSDSCLQIHKTVQGTTTFCHSLSRHTGCVWYQERHTRFSFICKVKPSTSDYFSIMINCTSSGGNSLHQEDWTLHPASPHHTNCYVQIPILLFFRLWYGVPCLLIPSTCLLARFHPSLCLRPQPPHHSFSFVNDKLTLTVGIVWLLLPLLSQRRNQTTVL